MAFSPVTPFALRQVRLRLRMALDVGRRRDVADARFFQLLTRADGGDRREPLAQADTSREWRLHFEGNARTLLDIPWELGADLTAVERRVIASSLQEFQAGEQSEGRHLHQAARDYAARTGDQEYVRAIRLFIAEEQRHARELGRFLTLNGIPLVPTTWADRVFRRLRTLLNSLELSIAVLITAELLARVYYAALRDATGSAVLRSLCAQILADERAHVAFQSQQLRKLRTGRPAPAAAAALAAQRALYAGTVLVVWWRHRGVIRRGGLSMHDWWTACWREFAAAFGTPRGAPATRWSGPAAR